jgi:hypothetical protein
MEYFPGMPQRPLSTEELWQKFSVMTATMPGGAARRLFDRLLDLVEIQDVARLDLSGS